MKKKRIIIISCAAAFVLISFGVVAWALLPNRVEKLNKDVVEKEGVEKLDQAVITREGTATVIKYDNRSCTYDGWCGYVLKDAETSEEIEITTGSGLSVKECHLASKTDNIGERAADPNDDGDLVGRTVKYQTYKYSCDEYDNGDLKYTGRTYVEEKTIIVEWL